MLQSLQYDDAFCTKNTLTTSFKNFTNVEFPTLDFTQNLLSQFNDIKGIYALANTNVELPIDKIKQLMEFMAANPELGERANAAYKNNLVWKDAKQIGTFQNNTDEKRTLDLSEQRLAAINANDPDLLNAIDLQPVLDFFQEVQNLAAPILSAIQKIGNFSIQEERYNFRIVDYYTRNRMSQNPRCGEHYDFGTMTLIFTDNPGLEVEINGEWKSPPVIPGQQNAYLLFGVCTKIRSQNTIPAIKHRVEESTSRRVSAVLFVSPKRGTKLTPSVTADDIEVIKRRRWQFREGTLLNEEDRRAEEEYRKMYPDQEVYI